MGFTVVDVNMRGTGCSGGAFDFFEPLQNLDGYDVIETIARQPWVQHSKVGMMGISYGGISQLFTAQTNPPSLAAISPLSVIDATQTTLYPGGILNTGFAVELGQGARSTTPSRRRPTAGSPGPTSGSRRATRPARPTRPCTAEAADLLAKIRANDHYVPKVADPLSPITFVDKIKVPMFMACQWTDEQTGGHCPTLAKRFTGTERKWFTFTNGTHVDSLAPETFNRWYDFLQLYVAKQAPITNSAVIRAAAPVIYQEAMGISGVTLPPDPIQQQPTYEGALAAFEQLQADPHPVRQRRRRLGARAAVSRLRALLLELPDPGHHRPLLVPRGQGRARRQAARARRGRLVHLGRPRPAADQLHRRHGRRRRRPLDRDAATTTGGSHPPAARRPT